MNLKPSSEAIQRKRRALNLLPLFCVCACMEINEYVTIMTVWLMCISTDFKETHKTFLYIFLTIKLTLQKQLSYTALNL